jgi:phosphatidylserine synthase
LTLPWIVVFCVAIFMINPYNEEGEAERAGVHQQLGLPECNFKTLVGVPCPSCGMTTSFTLLVRADVWNSMRANFAGTALATFGLLFIPWALISAFCGRFVLIRSIELVIFRLAIVFLIVLFGRWIFVLIWELLLNT